LKHAGEDAIISKEKRLGEIIAENLSKMAYKTPKIPIKKIKP